MKQGEKLALFLGMLSGDGCLSLKHSGEGYRDYPIDFCNTEKKLVILFDNLFFELFNLRGKISFRDRPNRKRIWHFLKYSVEIVRKFRNLGFPEGVKRDVLRILPIIKNGTKEEKLLFIYGFIITDGGLKKNKGLLFHLGSKLFLEDLSKLISEFTGTLKPIKTYTQRKIYKSYQLYLNKKEREVILGLCGTMVLRSA